MESNFLEKAINYNNIIVVFVSLMTVSHETNQNPPNTSRLQNNITAHKTGWRSWQEAANNATKNLLLRHLLSILTGTLEKHIVQVGNMNTEPDSSGK